MKVGIIILNYNDAENTIKMLEQIKEYSCIDKIVIVDNHSGDDSVERLKPFENEKIVLLEANENKGYANGNNLGLKYLEDYDYVFISNPDIVVDESVMEKLLFDMKKNPKLSFLGPKILENGTISRGWKLPTYGVEVLSTINYVHRFAKKIQKYPQEYYQEKLTPVEVVSGCFFLARMKDFKKIPYFDPHTFLYYEENIIGKKAKEKDLLTMVDTSVSVVHEYSQSVDKSFKKIARYKILKQSMFYYEETYNHIGFLKKCFLKFVYGCSLVVSYLTFWI